MVKTVNIRKEGNKIKVNFSYDTDLVDIMRSHKGYFYRGEKAWVFPSHKYDAIRSELKSKHYDVRFVTSATQTTFATKRKEKSEVLSTFGHCKKCGEGAFCNKDGLCVRCK